MSDPRRTACVLGCAVLLAARASLATQAVLLDFDSDTDPDEHVYTPDERAEILEIVQDHYAGFDYAISLEPPPSGPYSIILFNGPLTTGAVGQSYHVDFRNLIPDDSAVVNVNLLLSGPLRTSENVVAASSLAASHELGHIVGLRHGTAFGPIGAGISVPPGNARYSPPFPGPPTAFETNDHVMATTTTGERVDELLTPKHFGERSAVRLAFNERGHVVQEVAAPHGTPESAMPLEFRRLLVPNPLPSGENAGLGFDVEAVVVVASFDAFGEVDYYEFSAAQEGVFNFEVLSDVILHRLEDTTDPFMRIEDASGGTVPYYTSSTAFNDDDFDSTDSILIDVQLPADGVYRVGVSGYRVGPYELFGYRFATMPEPGRDLALLLGAALVAGCARRARIRIPAL